MDTSNSAVAIKSKERVQKHGEVFTPDSIVNDMLDLTDKELKGIDANGNIIELHGEADIKKYIDTTYLEPACGNGNFLIRILDRKLEGVQMLDISEQKEWLVHAVASIYGVDIQLDNVLESRARMLELIKNGRVDVMDLENKDKHPWRFKAIDLEPDVERVIKFILEKNIIHANCLSGHLCDASGETEEPLLFAEYTWKDGKVSVRGSGITDIYDSETDDFFENNGRFVDFNMIDTLNFTYSDAVDDNF